MNVPDLPKRTFTLLGLLFMVAALPVCVGVVAAVEFTAFEVAYSWLGIDWWNAIIPFLTNDVGLSDDIVAGYVTFALFDVPAWVGYCIIALVLGLLGNPWAHRSGAVLLASIALSDLLSDYHSGLHTLLNLRLVSLFGVLIATACFLAGRRLSPHGATASTSHPNTWYVGVGIIGITMILAASVYGWWLIELDRQAGLEVQQMFPK